MSSTIATTGDSIVQVHRGVATGARAAAAELPMVASFVGMQPSHVAILESALSETRKTLTELARVADVGAEGASALSEQDSENAGRYKRVPPTAREV